MKNTCRNCGLKIINRFISSGGNGWQTEEPNKFGTWSFCEEEGLVMHQPMNNLDILEEKYNKSLNESNR